MTRSVEPVRTCVGCRVRAAKSDLLRVVAVEGALLPDPRGTSSGRGAHLHPNPECLALAERRRAFPRALRLDGPLRAEALQNYVEHQHNDRQHEPEQGHHPDERHHPDQQSGTTP